MTFSRFVSFFMLGIFLLLPAQGIAQAVSATVFAAPENGHNALSADTMPSPDCPCSDHNHADCDSTCSCCSIIAPVPHDFSYAYALFVRTLTAADPYWVWPQVYLSIFVPPQNVA